MYRLEFPSPASYSDDDQLPPLVEPPTPLQMLRELQQQTQHFEKQLAILNTCVSTGHEEEWDRSTLDKFVNEISRTESHTSRLLQALKVTTEAEHGHLEHAKKITHDYKKYMNKLIERIAQHPHTGSFGKKRGLNGYYPQVQRAAPTGTVVLAHNQIKTVIDVLIVEDDPLQAVILEDMLEMCSNKDPDGFRFRTDTVASAQECLCKLREPHYMCNIVFIDLIMPNVSGFELLHSIRQLFGNNITIVMNSAHDNRDLVLGCFQGGADLYISKPIHIRSLQDIWQLTLKRQPHLVSAIAHATTSTASILLTLNQEGIDHQLCDEENACRQQ